MKTPDQIRTRISELIKEKLEIQQCYISAKERDKDFFAGENTRVNFMINELEWVLKK